MNRKRCTTKLNTASMMLNMTSKITNASSKNKESGKNSRELKMSADDKKRQKKKSVGDVKKRRSTRSTLHRHLHHQTITNMKKKKLRPKQELLRKEPKSKLLEKL